jgi:soluble lytic murein transglycosylase-like protein
VDICWDKTPMEVLAEAARAALKIPVKDKAEISRAASLLQRNQQAANPTPTRGGDSELVIKRAIAHFNPRLSTGEIEQIANSIEVYSERYEVHPYLVVAVVAAESRFNPNARSYKGAAGLGQLMPATAAAHGVDPYDPIANLEVAIRIISRNLKEFNNDWNKALAAYNAGRGAVNRYDGVPPYRETREYLWRIYEYWSWLNGTTPEPRPR